MREHTAAERSPFLAKIISGTVTLENHISLLSQYFFIYHTLETHELTLRCPTANIFFDRNLWRTPHLEHDLNYFLGHNWRTKISPLPPTQSYMMSIINSCQRPKSFIAHHYVRYLGDLSGGQIIASRLKNTLNLSEQGLNFYRFENIPKPKRYKDHYRTLLDSLPETPREYAYIVSEARRAYRLNTAVFNALLT